MDTPSNEYLSQRQKLNILETQMKNKTNSFEPLYRDLSDYILPRRGRFFLNDTNRGDRRDLNIIDNTAGLASRTLSSGMMTGVTSPARSWFKLKTSNREFNDIPNVKTYFRAVEEEMRGAFLRSNLYNVLPTLYGDLGTFATGAIFMEEDMDNVFNFHSLPIGSYWVGLDRAGKVNSIYREFEMSVRQIVEKYGMDERQDPRRINWDNISQVVKNYWERGQYESQITVSHFILPNENYRPGNPFVKFKKWASYYYERGINLSSAEGLHNVQQENKFLSVGGFDFFPVMAPRWEVVGEDTLGTSSPGMLCLGDVKQLQQGEKRIAEAIDQKVRPSMVGPTSLRQKQASILPGDITYVDEPQGTTTFRRLFDIQFDIRELENKQDQLRQRISRTFYEDLFLMLAQSDRRQITATEIEERHEEKLLALGPVLERINQDLLDPLIENAFAVMEKQGLLPEIPEELQEADYEIEYISVMAQAQKLAGIGNIERFMGFVGQQAQLDPNVIHKVNMAEVIEDYAEKVGVEPDLIKSKEEVDAILAEQQAAIQREQEVAEQAAMADAGQKLGNTKIEEDNALSQVLGGLSEE